MFFFFSFSLPIETVSSSSQTKIRRRIKERRRKKERLRGDWSGLESGAGESSFFLVALVLVAVVRLAAGDFFGGVFLGVADLEAESAFRVLMIDRMKVKFPVSNSLKTSNFSNRIAGTIQSSLLTLILHCNFFVFFFNSFSL